MQNQRKRTKKVMNSFQKDYCSIDFLVQKIYPFGGTAETIEPCTFDALCKSGASSNNSHS